MLFSSTMFWIVGRGAKKTADDTIGAALLQNDTHAGVTMGATTPPTTFAAVPTMLEDVYIIKLPVLRLPGTVSWEIIPTFYHCSSLIASLKILTSQFSATSLYKYR